MRLTGRLTSLSKHWNNPRGHRNGTKGAKRRNRRVITAIQPALLHCRTELLEARLLLTVTAPASATLTENGIAIFAPNGSGAITVNASPAGGTLSLTLSVSHGTLTLGSTTGLTFSAGSNGSASMTAVGTATNLNASLNLLSYVPTPGYSGDDLLQISAGSGAGSATVSLFINTWTNSTFASLVSEQQAAGGGGLAEGSDFALLLPNGDLMVHGSGLPGSGVSANWYEITPDGSGSYANGTWTQLASMNVARLDFSSVVLPNGDVFVLGGEYASDGPVITSNGPQYSNSAEIYDPATNVWTQVASDPHTYTGLPFPGFSSGALAGDQPSEVLPNGDVLVGNIFDNGTEIYDPATNQWSNGPAKVHTSDQSDEESWVKLPNGDILCYDNWSSITDGHGEAELLVGTSNPATMHWVDASHGSLRFLSTNATGNELGPALLGVVGGKALFTGANGRTEFYDPGTNSWSKGPDMPIALLPGKLRGEKVEVQLTLGDGPGAVLPNGDDLLALSPPVVGATQTFPSPTFLYEYDPVTNVFTDVSPNPTVSNTVTINSFQDSMLVLPTGQVLLMNQSPQLAFYTLAPGDGPNPSWAPTITSYTQNINGNDTLTGTQLNGLDEGAAYGDDKQMAENYPLVQLTSLFTGTVYYATTSNWSSTGVATGNSPESVNFVLPPTMPNGFYIMVVIADGIASRPVIAFEFQLPPFTFPFQSTALAQPGLALDGSLANPSVDGQLSAVASPGNIDNSSPASPALMLSATNVTSPATSAPGMSLDLSSNTSTSETDSLGPSNQGQFQAAQFDALLSDPQRMQWAGLNAALDILGA
jgi:hypothetical protein